MEPELDLPELTVVVPTRERPEYLEVAVLSILTSAAEAKRALGASTRVLVVDDASPSSSTRDVALRLGVDYVRVDVHDGRPNPNSAIVLGLARTESEYVTIFGDDDVMLPRHVPVHLAAMRGGADVSAASYYVGTHALGATRVRELPEAHLGDYLAGVIMVNDGAFVRTKLVREVELDPANDAQLLYPLWAELLIQGRRFVRSTEPTFVYRRHLTNISDTLDARDEELRTRLQQQYRERAREVLGEVPPPRPVDLPA